MIQLGDYNTGATIDFKFSTVSQTNTPITLAGSPAVAVYKANGTTETTTGVTLTVDFDTRTGLHNVRVVTSDSFYATGEDFDVVLTAGTVDSVSVAGRVLAHFTINKASADVRRVSGTAVTAGTGFPAVDASSRVDLGKVMGEVLTLSGDVVTFPFGLKLAPATTLVHALELAGAVGGAGIKIIGGTRDGVSDTIKPAVWVIGSGDAQGVEIYGGTGMPALYLEKGSGSTYDAILGDVSGVVTNVTLTATTTNLTNLPTIPANWLTAAGIAAGALDGKGNWNIGKTGYALTATTGLGNQTANITGTITTTTNLTNAPPDSSGVTTLLARIGAFTGTGVNTVLGFFKALLSSAASTPSDVGGTFLASTDSTEAIRDRGDAAWTGGGGGTADWTADERTAIRAILGVPGSGTTPTTPTTGMLDTINDNIAALSAGAGSGAFVVTITVNDGTNPLENATVRLTEGVNSFRVLTNVSGIATFSLNAATYTRSITKDGFTFTPNSLVVAGVTSSTSSMTATVVSGSPGPGLISKTITILDVAGAPVANIGVTFTLTITPTGVNAQVVDGNNDTRLSNINGEITYTFIRNATYQLRSGLTGEVISFLVPNSGDFTIPSFRRVT